MKRILVFAIALAAALPLAAQSFPEGDVAAYIDAVDAVMLPVNCKGRMAVVDTFSSGDDRASDGFFIRKDNRVVWVATAPASQKNFALLRDQDIFWERFAATNKVVKTSATANSRGGETSNLDLTRFNTNLDYTVKYIGDDDVDGKACYQFELRAKNRKLAYSLVHLWVDKATRIPVKKAFYAVSEKVLKYYTVTRAEVKDNRVVVMEMEYVDALKPQDTSRLRIFDITPLARVPEQFFTREYLESGRLYPYEF
ncbi:MAG TPA: outer membrane lipoprotein-sorting protein [Spirochaetia bacterium]|nr:outer membrane lipoprotein-sorting protein [Spirochaetia bacterium]